MYYYQENDHNSDANTWSEEIVQLIKIVSHLIFVRRRCTDFHRNPLEPGPRGGKTVREGIEDRKGEQERSNKGGMCVRQSWREKINDII